MLHQYNGGFNNLQIWFSLENRKKIRLNDLVEVKTLPPITYRCTVELRTMLRALAVL
jgi:hypothetical protein